MVFKVRICLFVLILNFPFLLFSQTFRPINPKVKVNGKILAHPWSGGMNCPQIMNADIDLDGIQDIVILIEAEESGCVLSKTKSIGLFSWVQTDISRY